MRTCSAWREDLNSILRQLLFGFLDSSGAIAFSRRVVESGLSTALRIWQGVHSSAAISMGLRIPGIGSGTEVHCIPALLSFDLFYFFVTSW